MFDPRKPADRAIFQAALDAIGKYFGTSQGPMMPILSDHTRLAVTPRTPNSATRTPTRTKLTKEARHG